jgi:hypothetical protein
MLEGLIDELQDMRKETYFVVIDLFISGKRNVINKQHRQCMYNVTLGSVRLCIVAV